MKKKCGLLLVALLFAGCFSGCYDSREVDDMAYAMAIGIDKGKTQELKLTFQFASPKAGSGSGSEEGGGGDNLAYTTIEAPTIFSGLNMVNNYISKQVNMSHAKLIVFSKELAQEGIYKYVNSLFRGREFRGNMFVAVSRTSAEEFVKAAEPKLQSNGARLYEGMFNTYQYTGFSSNTQLVDLYRKQQATTSQAIATLVGVGRYNDSEEFTEENSTFQEKGDPKPLEGDYKAGDLPKTYETKAEIMGLAVFDGTKMVGELDGEEAAMYLIVTGKYNYSYISMPDPKNESDYVVLNVKQSRKPVNKVDISGENPKIKSEIRLEADIVAIQSGYNYENPDLTPELETAAENYIKETMMKFLQKTSKEYKSDICGFGQHVKGKFWTWKQWEEYNWLRRYRDSEFDVEVDLKIRRPGLIVKTVPSYNTQGDESK